MQRLAARDAETLSLFGTGVQARAHAEAFLLTHPFQRVLVAGRASAPEFANWVQTEFGVPATAVDAATAASRGDVICTATRASEPLFDGDAGEAGRLRGGRGLEQAGGARTRRCTARARRPDRRRVAAGGSERGGRVRARGAGHHRFRRA